MAWNSISFCAILVVIVGIHRLEIIYFREPPYRKLQFALSLQKDKLKFVELGTAMPETIYYRRKLPHIHPQNNPLFITFSLVDSLPTAVVAELKTQREKELQASKNTEERYSIQKKYFGYYDEWLDRCEHGHDWLKKESVAQLVANEIHQAASRHYDLYAYCIMSNHVHMLILSLIEKFPPSKMKSAISPIAEIMRLLKGRTARFCNLALNRTGKFWHHEYYDHYVRDEKELERIIHYILNNPVKAGLVNEWKDWKFTYVNPELGEW